MQYWADQLDQNTQAFQAAFGHLTNEQLNWKPSSDRWSIAQNIDHLMVINRSYYPIFDELQKGTYRLPWLARFDFLVNWLGGFILGSVQPDRQRKIRTFPIWEPSASTVPEGVLARFVAHQTEFKARIADLKAFIEGGTVICSPANRNIFYRLETALDIIVAHEQRHLEQAKEVLAHI